MKRNQSNEAVLQQLVQSFQEANQAIVESAVAVQERNMQFAQHLYSDWLAALQDHTHNHRTLICLLYTSPSPRDYAASRMPSSA